MTTQLTNYVDVGYSEEGIKQEIEDYKAAVNDLISYSTRHPHPEAQTEDWLEFCKELWFTWRNDQMLKCLKSLSPIERSEAIGYQHTQHNNIEGEDSRCDPQCEYRSVTKDGIPNDKTDDYFDKNWQDMIGTLYLYNTHKRVIPAQDYANNTKAIPPSNIAIC